MAQCPDAGLFATLDAETNSIAIIVKHLAGNMRSRWTDFLTSDGEKPDRNRDAEFEQPPRSRAELLEVWETGWTLVFSALEAISDGDLTKTIVIRGEPHSVMQAINRQVAHYSYHIGQIVCLAKHFGAGDWKALTIPRGDRRSSPPTCSPVQNRSASCCYSKRTRARPSPGGTRHAARPPVTAWPSTGGPPIPSITHAHARNELALLRGARADHGRDRCRGRAGAGARAAAGWRVSRRDSCRCRQRSRSVAPDLALLRRRRAELRLHEGRAEAARRTRTARARARVFPRRTTCSRPATARRRSSGARPTPTARMRTGSRSTTGRFVDRIFDTYLDARREAVRADRLHAARPSRRSPSRTSTRGARGQVRRDLHRLGVSTQGLREVGRARLPVGRSTASSDTAAPKSSSGTGRSGTSPTSATGSGTPEEFHKLHDYAIDGVRRALPTARVGGPDAAGTAGTFMRGFLDHALRARTTRPARPARRSTSSRSTPKAARVRGRPRAHGHREPAARRSTRASRIIASYPELKAQADRDRRIAIRKAARRARGRSSATATAPCIRATRRRASRACTISPTGTA